MRGHGGRARGPAADRRTRPSSRACGRRRGRGRQDQGVERRHRRTARRPPARPRTRAGRIEQRRGRDHRGRRRPARASAATPAAASGSRPRGVGSTASSRRPGCVPTTGHFPRVGPASDGRTHDRAARRRSRPRRDRARRDRGTRRARRRRRAGAVRTGPAPGDRPHVRGAASRSRSSRRRLGRRRRRPRATARFERRGDGATSVVLALARRGARRDPALLGPRHADRASRSHGSSGTGTASGAARLTELADVDVLRRPGRAPTVAPRHRAIGADDFVFTLPASLTGSPALSVPMGARREPDSRSRCS